MGKMHIYLAVFLTFICFASTGFSGDKTHWGYSGHEGPEYWGDLLPEYSPCSKGRNQSPIDLTQMINGDLPPIKIDYQPGGNEVINNGHTIRVNYKDGSTITVDGQTFELKQFHFHSPSENIIQGKSFPMEAHFVHADANGNLAVIALMFEKGKKNTELEKAWAHMPGDSHTKSALKASLSADALLPKDRSYYRFNGSLTTPPCSEGVRWLVMKSTALASREQIEKFVGVMGHPNNRPVQPANARMVIE